MIEFKNIEGIYFVGIGGIGMSGIAEVLAERHRNPQTFEKVFGRALAILQYCRISMRAQDSLPIFLKDIDDTLR